MAPIGLGFFLPPCPYPAINNCAIPTDGVKLDIGCGLNKQKGFIGVDWASPDADIKCDIEGPLPIDSDYADFILCSHVFEHIRNFRGLMDDLWRVLKGERMMIVRVPRYDFATAYGDPEHIRFFHPNQFLYFTPLWHYANGVKPWWINRICWCTEDEITCEMTPVKTEEMMTKVLAKRDELRAQVGGKVIGYA